MKHLPELITNQPPGDTEKAPVSFFTGTHIKGTSRPENFSYLLECFTFWEDPDNKPLVELTKYLQRLKEKDKTAYKGERARICPVYQIGHWETRKDCRIYVPILVFDVDGCDEATYLFNLSKCEKISFIYRVMPSLGGGMRIMVITDSTPDTHKAYYTALCQLLSKLVGIPLKSDLKGHSGTNNNLREHIDDGTNAINQLWFACHTPTSLIYHNEESEIFYLPGDEGREITKELTPSATSRMKKRPQGGSYPVEYSQREKIENLICQIEKNRQDITQGMTNIWFPKVLLSLANEFGHQGRDLAHRVSRFHSDYTQEETDKEYDRALAKDQGKVRIGTFYALCKSFGYLVDFDQLNEQYKGLNGSHKPVSPNPEKVAIDGQEENESADKEAEEQLEEPISNKQAKELEEALRKVGDYRYNEITRMPEFRKKGIGSFVQMDDYSLNSITRKLRLSGTPGATKTRIAETIESGFSPMVNPVEVYFKELRPDSQDQIKALCATVSPLEGQSEMFEKYFKKWLVGTVANIFIKDRCANHLCFILTGQQGAFKSTWIRLLCPPALINYYFEGNLDPENKDDLFATTANFIYNLDDYFAEVTKKKINSLKSFITKDTVNARRAYGRYPEELPKICSFIASSNDDTFLHDPTGNRRFIPFEVTAIDIEAAKRIDIDQVWGQAYALFRKGFIYWLSRDDQKELKEHNSKYEVQSLEFELVNTYFQPPTNRNEATAYLTTADIIDRLAQKSSIRMTPKKVGEAMKKAGFDRFQKRLEGKSNPSWVYAIDFTEEIDIQDEKTTGRGLSS